MKKADDLLILNQDNFSENVASFVHSVEKTRSAQEVFLKNPVGYIRKYVFPDNDAPVAKVNQANRVVLSLLSNPKFLAWSEQFQRKMEGKASEISASTDPEEAVKLLAATFDRTEVYREVAQSVIDFGDPELIFSLLVNDRDSLSQQINPGVVGDVAVEIETFIYAVVVAAAFAVAVAAVFVGASDKFTIPGINRQDLLQVSGALGNRLVLKAGEIRRADRLSSFSAVKRGSIL